MKTVFSLLFLFILASFSFATVRTINVANFQFSPTPLNAFVGDTIKWVWVSGNHTTTSTNIPLTASSWDSPIDASNTTFSYVILSPGTYNYKCTPHESMGMVGAINAQVSSITGNEQSVQNFELKQNYPNPFNPSTSISFSVPKSGFVKLTIFNSLGSEVETLVNENLNRGSYTVNFNASKLSSGVYFYRLNSGDFIETRKMLLIK
jgi:plastocyanin